MTTIQRIAALSLLVANVLVTPGCLVLSLSPLYDDSSIEYEPALVGAWENAEDDVSVLVARGQWRSYAVTWSASGTSGRATARLTRLAGEWYADLMPAAGEERGPLLVPAHGLCRIRLAADTLSIEPLAYEWLSAQAARGLLPQVVHDERDNVLLTAPTASLRTWLARNHERAALFDAALTLTRRAASTTLREEDGPATARGHPPRSAARSTDPCP